MQKQRFQFQKPLRFKQFRHKSYALFSCLGKVVLVGVLSVSTLQHAKAKGISTRPLVDADSLVKTDRELDEVVIDGSRAPLAALQTAKIVAVVTREEVHRAAAATVNDVLKLTTGVDVRQRGGFGVQTDISIDGGTFDQIALFLNGIYIGNPQTGHNATDFPVALDDIERIEILEGAARPIGSSAFSGAINIITRKPRANEISIAADAGSHGTVGADGRIALGKNLTRHTLSGGYTRSDGGSDNSDFRKGRVFYSGSWGKQNANLFWQMGWSTQDYGANTFYSAKFNNQYERTSHLVGSVRGHFRTFSDRLELIPSVYYNRFRDHYQLIRDAVGAENGENYHIMDVYGGALNAVLGWALGETAIGADIRKERIFSTAYGDLLDENDWRSVRHSDRYYTRKGERTNTSLFVEHHIEIDRLRISAGLLANRNTYLDHRFHVYPGVDVSFRANECWKLYASWNKAMRLPTYTDLYTNNAAQLGDLSLKPETNSTLKIGSEYRAKGLQAVVSGFYSRGKNMIDWVYESENSTRYHALNIGKLDNLGYSLNFSLSPETLWRIPITQIRVGYAFIHQRHETAQQIYKSLYALEYLKHKVVCSVDHRIWRQLSANWSLRWQQRVNGYHPYTKIDCKLRWQMPQYEIYLSAENLTNHRYYDLGSVLQPGIWLMAGGKWRIKF